VNPAIAGGSAVVNNLNNQPMTDQFGQPGFPGFDGLFATTTLAYIAQMQEQGIPVTFGYIADAHDQHGVAGEIHATRGPAVPQTLQTHREALRPLGEVYKQLSAPFGQFGMDALAMSTRAIKSGSANDDSTYTALENKLKALTQQRDELAEQMRSMLEEAAFGAQEIEKAQALALIVKAETLLHQVHRAAQP